MAKETIGTIPIRDYVESLMERGYSREEATKETLKVVRDTLLDAPWTIEELEKLMEGIKRALHKSKG